MSVPIPREVHDGIKYVQAARYSGSGYTQMLDVEQVQALARNDGFEATASWIEDHEQAYAKGVLFGFDITGNSFPQVGGGERE